MWKYILLFLAATTKFVIATGMAFTINASSVLLFFILAGGGIFGTWFYLTFIRQISAWLQKKGLVNVTYKKKRRSVSMRKKFGLIGIAILSPLILSIPFGSFLASTVEADKKRILLYFSISVIFFSLLIVVLKDVFNINLAEYIFG